MFSSSKNLHASKVKTKIIKHKNKIEKIQILYFFIFGKIFIRKKVFKKAKIQKRKMGIKRKKYFIF